MKIHRNRTFAMIGLFATIVAQASAQATLSLGGPPLHSGGTINNAGGGVNWSMTYYTPRLLPAVGQVNAAASANFNAAFNKWNANNGNNYNLNYVANTSAMITVEELDPTLTPGGFGDLDFDLSLAYPAGTVTGALPNPSLINGPWGPTDAIWTQSVSSNAPLVGNAQSAATPNPPLGVNGMRSYMDINAAAGSRPPAYPAQFDDSEFIDDPARQGIVGQTIYWQGDAMLSTITRPNGKIKGSVNVLADVFWGFQITGVAGNMMNPIFAQGTDIGNIPSNSVPQAVPEPTSTAVLGLGVSSLVFIRRRKKK